MRLTNYLLEVRITSTKADNPLSVPLPYRPLFRSGLSTPLIELVLVCFEYTLCARLEAGTFCVEKWLMKIAAISSFGPAQALAIEDHTTPIQTAPEKLLAGRPSHVSPEDCRGRVVILSGKRDCSTPSRLANSAQPGASHPGGNAVGSAWAALRNGGTGRYAGCVADDGLCGQADPSACQAGASCGMCYALCSHARRGCGWRRTAAVRGSATYPCQARRVDWPGACAGNAPSAIGVKLLNLHLSRSRRYI